MDDKAPRKPARKPRRPRRLLKASLGLLILGVVAVAALPWLMGTAPARGWLVGRVNARLAPGSIGLEGLSMSWTGPIELSGVALRDPEGKRVLAARGVRLDRGLLGLLASRPDYGTITVEGATVDVERRADGTIDALEALASVLTGGGPEDSPGGPKDSPGDPGTAVSVVLRGGTLRLASPELVEPVAAATLDGTLAIVPGKPLEASATLGDGARSLAIRATMDHRDPAGDRSMAVVGRDWPIHVRRGGIDALGRLEGTLEARRAGGLWSTRADAALVGVVATGPALAGDRLALDRVALAGDAGQAAAGWSARSIELATPVGSLSARGSWPSTAGARLQGRVDLAALSRMLPHAMRLKDGLALDRGTASLRVELAEADGSGRFELAASLDDLAARAGDRPMTLREPARLTASGTRAGGKVTVGRVELKAAGVDVVGSGDLEAGVKLQGTIDLAALDAQARDWLDLGAVAASGHARVGADYRHVGDDYKVRLAADCKALHLAGVADGPIDRDSARLDASAIGPRAPDGTPTGWREARLDLKAGDLALDLTATHQDDDSIAVLAGAGADVASPTPGRAEVKAAFVARGRAFEVEQLRAGIVPADPASGPGAPALAVRGRLDLASGEGAFTPLPGSPVAAVGLAAEGLRVAGLGRADGPLRLDAALIGDLGALDRLLAAWSGSAPRGLGGTYGTHCLASRSASGRLEFGGQVDVPDLVAPGLRGPTSLAWKTAYEPGADRAEVAVNLATIYGLAALGGTMAEVKARRIYDLSATLQPRWEAIDPVVASALGAGAQVRATVKPIHMKGWLQADSTPRLLSQQVGAIELDLESARAWGVTLGPAPVVLRLGGGGAVFDPIRTTANGGPVAINANLIFDDAYGIWLRLGPGTRVEGAAINDAVSESLLAFVAPVLARATEVNGKVSADVDRASLPITGAGSTAIEGRLVFQDVEFRPGPMGAEVASMVGRPAPKLTLRAPMQFQVADGRVRQSGLSIPLAGSAKVDFEGSVGLDKSVDLKATIPLSARLLGLDPRFEPIVGGARLEVPIRGTMARPSVDGPAFRAALRDAARSAASRGLESEARGLLDRVAGPNPTAGEPKGKPARRDPLGTLEELGREILDSKKP